MAIHPVEVKNTFLSHFILWALFLPLLTIISVPLFSPDQGVQSEEVEMLRSFGVNLDKVNASANDTFTSVFIATGVMQSTEGLVNTKFPSSAATRYAAKWLRGVYLMIYKSIWRLYALTSMFFIPVLALCIPSAVDGFMIRARKSYKFETSNPVFFYSSMHVFSLVFGLFFFLPIAPVTLSANILAVMLCSLAIAVWVASSNFQSGN
ncbi:hypothetical protein CSQ92_10080 [Janthinobacterium sp. BJB446]|uniref:DUF4400 domain-containing protein n=1 Tax=Janthinobacterium sp. BJB446 TaxID=2048009 RepID=UPI000C0D7D7B|nr:DUF4400 domain-containing protein [Janthinobacterium sp. BJB446]PHV23317.1 hypothetical protein CSQ92_10080 [Janthinobacterium sp. BJB446]